MAPKVVIDAPGPNRTFAAGDPILLAGWAADLDAIAGTGIATVHVWAYPASGGAPTWLGEASYGGHRPDVGAILGSRFARSGYGLHVRGLEPGDYRLAVFAWSTAQRRFLPAQVTGIAIR